jgi:Ca2+-binding RTX toxin-like protein
MPAAFTSSRATGNALLDTIDTGFRWTGTIGYNRVDPDNPAEVSAFSAALPTIYVTQGIGLTNAMWSLVGRSFEILQSYANITFELTNAADANYFVSDFSRPDSPNTAGIAARPGNTPILAFNVGTWETYSDQQQIWIVLHELGHTLGLRHPTGTPPELDFSQYTIMSSDWFTLGDFDVGGGLPLTPMALDVAVLQANYGAAANNVGDTRYSLSRFILDDDGADGTMQNGGGYICIWDTSGTDTLSYGGTTAALLNLNAATLLTTSLIGDLADVIGDVVLNSSIFAGLSAFTRSEIIDPVRSAGGFFSSLLQGDRREPGGYVIANGARIESASGGSGGDLIIGNAFANTLRGNGGADNLFGGSGDDSLEGGADDDRIFGGLGNDTITDDSGVSNYLRGDEGDDLLMGGAGFCDINGNMGNDTVVAGTGDSWAVGGKDNDSLSGGAGQNLVYGNLGNDTCDGGAGNDTIRGGQDNDVVSGGDGADFVSGDKGDDTMAGGSGADIFHTFGDAGIDRVLDFNLSAGDRVQLGPGTQFTTSQVGEDTVINMTGGGQMVLVGVSLTTLTGNWIFGA